MILYATLAQGPRLPLDLHLNLTRQFMRELNRPGITSAVDAGGGFQNYPEDDDVVDEPALPEWSPARGARILPACGAGACGVHAHAHDRARKSIVPVSRLFRLLGHLALQLLCFLEGEGYALQESHPGPAAGLCRGGACQALNAKNRPRPVFFMDVARAVIMRNLRQTAPAAAPSGQTLSGWRR